METNEDFCVKLYLESSNDDIESMLIFKKNTDKDFQGNHLSDSGNFSRSKCREIIQN